MITQGANWAKPKFAARVKALAAICFSESFS
jgi:hypothetical protein